MDKKGFTTQLKSCGIRNKARYLTNQKFYNLTFWKHIADISFSERDIAPRFLTHCCLTAV